MNDRYISHHGIKGQKWGVRNGPPYPLDKKQKPTQFDTKKVPGLKKAGGINVDNLISNAQKIGKDYVKNTVSIASSIASDPVASISAIISDPAAVMLISAVALNAVKDIVVSQVRNHASKQEFQKSMDLTMEAIKADTPQLNEEGIADTNKKFSNSSPPKKLKDNGMEASAASVNPLYKQKGILGTKNNNTPCAIAYDMRRRGYDVIANLSRADPYMQESCEQVYDKPRFHRAKHAASFKGIENKLLRSFPDSARGIINLGNGFKRSVLSFEITGHQLYIIDSQKNKIYKGFSSIPFVNELEPSFTNYARLDNLKVNFEKLNLFVSEKK